MQRPTHPSFGCVKPVLTDKKMKAQNRSSKIIDIVSYALEMSVNGVTSVFVVHFM